MNRRLAEALLLAAAALALPAQAQERREPVQLEADHAEMSQATGVGVYTGNVVLTRGGMTITGDRMTVHTQQRELDRVIVEGDLARFEQQRPRGEQPVRGQAPRMEYHAGSPEHVLLLGGATLWQGKNEFSGETMRYDVASERVTARGEGERRTRITLFPREEGGRE